jgi:GNAT superfamily N-acetyltransferase
MPTVEVKPLAPRQARDEVLVGEIVQVINAAYAAGEAGLWLEGAPRTGPGEIADAIRGGGLLAATLEGRLVGCAYVRPLEAETADLGLISAVPDQWGRGVGRELVRSAEELMRSQDVTTMQLELLVPKGWVHPEKDRLRSWYTRLGYRVVRTAPVGEVAPQIESGLAVPCEFLIFRKPLSVARRHGSGLEPFPRGVASPAEEQERHRHAEPGEDDAGDEGGLEALGQH